MNTATEAVISRVTETMPATGGRHVHLKVAESSIDVCDSVVRGDFSSGLGSRRLGSSLLDLELEKGREEREGGREGGRSRKREERSTTSKNNLQ